MVGEGKGATMDDRDRIRWADDDDVDDPEDAELLAAMLAARRDQFAELAELNEVA